MKTQTYEFVFILPPDKKGEKEVLGEVKKIIEKGGGKVTKEDEWGEKELAYPINHYQKGRYFLWQVSFSADSSPSREINTFLNREKNILRYLWVKIKAPKAALKDSKN
ncbi:30S ribosomal protein S6 [bacterium]|nr:30S ribosomal protein S6 [bacterium]